MERRYAEETDDRLHMESFYDNYCDPQTVGSRRNYPVVCVNYHKLWDNKEAVVKALGLPAEEAQKVMGRGRGGGVGIGLCGIGNGDGGDTGKNNKRGG